MRFSLVAAFSVGAAAAFAAAYVLELAEPNFGPDEVRTIVAQQLKENPTSLSDADIGPMVAAHLRENPDIVIDAIRTYQQRQQQAERDAQVDMVQAHWPEIAHSPGDPVLGNPDGDVTLVEFFDYRCGYCKRAFPDVEALQKSNPNLRIVLKEYPILGPQSVFASRVALAAGKQNLAAEFHTAAMQVEGEFTEDRVMEIAQGVGLDIEKLRQDMEDPEIQQTIDRNYALAERLGIRGTPAFVTRTTIIPGAVGLEALQAAIDEASKKES